MNRFTKVLLVLITFIIIDTFIFSDENSIEVAFYEAGYLFNRGEGIDKDIILELEKRLGVKYKHTVKPRARIWYELKEGLLPMSVSGVETEERKKFAWFVPYIAQKNKVIMLKEHSEKYNNLEDFLKDKNTKVAVVRGFSHGMFYDDMLKRIERDRINEVPDLERLFILLKNKRVDLVISLSSFYRYEFKKFNMEELVEIKDWDKEEIGVVYGGLVLSKQYFDINEYKYIYNIFVDMKRDGTLEKIALKYLTKEEVEEASRLLDLKYFNRNNP